MSPDIENPCIDRLTPECFEHFPKLAKHLFFYRLLHLLLPVQVTNKLPVIFRQAILFLGAQFPDTWTPGDPPPEGANIPPSTIFPPGWVFGDPWPPGVLIWDPFTAPDFIYLADGTIINPGSVFPEGWSPGDPLPEGITLLPGDPGNLQDGLISPMYSDIFSIGPSGGATGASGGRAGAYLFFDDFETLDLSEWTVNIAGEGTIDIVSEKLRMQKTIDAGLIYLLRTDADIPGSRYNFSFNLQFISGTSYFQFQMWDGSYEILLRFLLPDTLEIYDGSSWQPVALSDFTNVEYTWRFNIENGKVDIYQDGGLRESQLDLEVDLSPPGAHRFILADTGNVRVDNFRLTGI